MLTSTSRGIHPNQCIQASRCEYPGGLVRTPCQAGQGMPLMKVLLTSPGFFLGWWQWSGFVCASFLPLRSWESLVTPDCPTSVSPSLGVLGSRTQIRWGLSWAANPATIGSCCAHKPSPAAASGGSPPWPSHSRSIRTGPNVSTAVLHMLMQNSTGLLCLQLFQGLYKSELLVNKYSPLFTYFTLKMALFSCED